MEEGRRSFKILIGIPTRKRLPIGSPRRRWEDKLRMNLKEIVVSAGNCIDLNEDRDYWRAVMNAKLNFWVLKTTELVIKNLDDFSNLL
jgi:hypothetical protein